MKSFALTELLTKPKKAIIAVAASMLTAAYPTLRDDVDYRDLGSDYFVRIDRNKAATGLVKRLSNLGFTVEIREAAEGGSVRAHPYVATNLHQTKPTYRRSPTSFCDVQLGARR